MTDLNVPPPPTSNHPHVPSSSGSSSSSGGSIIYTETDEAPSLATYNLLPILTKFASLGAPGVDVVPCDISLAGRVLAAFPERLTESQRRPDNLSYLGELATRPEANIVKLPNISASVPQLNDCVAELRAKGYDVPLYPPGQPETLTDEERNVKARYAKVLGSAVNPVLRKGNSDRHTSDVVKADAMRNPSRLMKHWSRASRSHVAHMTKGDFYGSERSAVVGDRPVDAVIELVANDGAVTVLKESTKLLPGEVIDGSFMDVNELRQFFESEMKDAMDSKILFSLHLKATMMKVSDPILFGHCVRTFFKDAFDKHKADLGEIGVRPNEGLKSVLRAVKESDLPRESVDAILADFDACYETRPWLAMVDSDRGITNLHVPSDVIIDNSMPLVVRDAGRMWNKLGKLEDVKCCIPDRSYATTYQEVLSYVKTHGQFDPATMGNVCNVGLMALKAEEYGSHDKTFEIPFDGTVRVRDKDGPSGTRVFFEHKVRKGDVWRMCQTKDEPIRDWVRLAVERARETQASGTKTIFWLDPDRAHDASILKKVNEYLPTHDTSGLDIEILKPEHAVRISMERATKGLDTISVTGNVLRDYLTDLFPILELGTSAKVLSIVPLLAGGGLYETGAGGSAPKHVQQFVKCSHLRWNSLGEYQAVAEAFVRLGRKVGNDGAVRLGKCLFKAVGLVLERHELPERRVHEPDNRDANFFLALHWAQFLAEEDDAFGPIFHTLDAAKDEIAKEIATSQGKEVDLGGYYFFDYDKANRAMNPSETLNEILGTIEGGGGGGASTATEVKTKVLGGSNGGIGTKQQLAQ